MRTSPLGAVYNRWTQPSYEIKVRGMMQLWGSAGITKNIIFEKPLLLHIHNDLFGEVITFGTQKAAGTKETLIERLMDIIRKVFGMHKASGTKETIGTLQPGEFVSIPLNNISGVFGSCEKESTVCCLIK